MKAGLLKKIASDYAGLFPVEWRRAGSEFLRRRDDWVQIVSFNPSRFDDTYVPKCGLEFLKMPGDVTAGFLPQELRHPKHDVQRWISMKEHEFATTDVFQEMVRQFTPVLDHPLLRDDITKLLTANETYWPHPYALCVMAAERGELEEARRYYTSYLTITSDRPYDWAEMRRQELATCIKLMTSPNELKAHLLEVQETKAAFLKG
jgi:hypothetical protein